MATTKSEIAQWALTHGYGFDSYGHLHTRVCDKSGEQREYRFKLGKTSVRWEVKVSYGKAAGYYGRHSEWVRIRSGYYCNLTITDEGKLAGMKR